MIDVWSGASNRKMRLPWMAVFVSDLLASPEFRRLTLAGQGIVHRLAALQWHDRIPIAPRAIMDALDLRGNDRRAFRRLWERIEFHFPIAGEERQNPGIARARVEAEARHAARQRNGQKGGRAAQERRRAREGAPARQAEFPFSGRRSDRGRRPVAARSIVDDLIGGMGASYDDATSSPARALDRPPSPLETPADRLLRELAERVAAEDDPPARGPAS